LGFPRFTAATIERTTKMIGKSSTLALMKIQPPKKTT
jgi:hypothetical protein